MGDNTFTLHEVTETKVVEPYPENKIVVVDNTDEKLDLTVLKNAGIIMLEVLDKVNRSTNCPILSSLSKLYTIKVLGPEVQRRLNRASVLERYEYIMAGAGVVVRGIQRQLN